MYLRARPLLIAVIAFGLIMASVLIRDDTPASASIENVALCVAMVLAVIAGGWVGGAVALLLLSSIELVTYRSGAERMIEEIVECLIVIAAVGAGRDLWMQLRLSESKLRALLGSVPDKIVVFNRRGECVDIEPASEVGRLPPDMLGRCIREVFPAETAELVVRTVERALDESCSLTLDYSVTIEEETRWLSATVSPTGDSEATWVARDVTSRKRMEDELKRGGVELEWQRARR